MSPRPAKKKKHACYRWRKVGYRLEFSMINGQISKIEEVAMQCLDCKTVTWMNQSRVAMIETR